MICNDDHSVASASVFKSHLMLVTMKAVMVLLHYRRFNAGANGQSVVVVRGGGTTRTVPTLPHLHKGDTLCMFTS